MAKQKSAPKKKIGRPITVNSAAVVTIRLSADMDKAIGKFAKAENISKAEAIRQLIEAGLEAKC